MRTARQEKGGWDFFGTFNGTDRRLWSLRTSSSSMPKGRLRTRSLRTLDLDLHYSAWFACQHAVLRYSFSRTVKQTKVPPDPESIEPAGIRGVPDQLQCRGLRAAAKQASGMGAGSATRAAAPASGHGRHHECPPVPTKVFVCLLVGGQDAEDDRGDDPVPLAEPFCDREGAKMARGFRFLVQEARPCPNHSFNEKGSCHALPSMILEVIISP